MFDETKLQRFWAKVEKTDDCWEWTAGTVGGYGYFCVQATPKKMDYVHRISYRLHHGEIPTGIQVMHSCDNPPCVNPDHLSLGTAGDNAADKARKGRAPRTNTKLSESDIREIRDRLSEGHLQKNIASDYGVARCTISLIKTGARASKIK